MRRSTNRSRARRNLQIEPALGWTYLSREALTRAKAQMDTESMGVRDEIGGQFLTGFPFTHPVLLHAKCR